MFYVKDCAGGGVSDLPWEGEGGREGGGNNLAANLFHIWLIGGIICSRFTVHSTQYSCNYHPVHVLRYGLCRRRGE